MELLCTFRKALAGLASRLCISKKAIAEIKQQYAALPMATAATGSWKKYSDRLKHLVANDDVRNFLQWDVIKSTMFIETMAWTEIELAFLKRSEWARWGRVLREHYTGNPARYAAYSRSSANLIHHVYHLARFEECLGIALPKTGAVFEFGGGYGSLCRVFHAVGYHGYYSIFDLPELVYLQNFYLRSLGIPTGVPLGGTQPGVHSFFDATQLAPVLTEVHNASPSIFVATWSLSEATDDLRQMFSSVIGRFDHVLIAYQDAFDGRDNTSYFRDMQKNAPNIRWVNCEIEHIPGNFYLFGTKKQQ